MTPADLLATATVRPEEADLTNCDREAIHIPGTIQPHGVLLAMAADRLEILQVSQNAAAWLGRSPEELIGQGLENFLDAHQIAVVRACSSARRKHTEPIKIAFRSPEGLRSFDGIAHWLPPGRIILELERPHADSAVDFLSFLQLVKEPAAEFQKTNTTEELSAVVAAEVRRLTGFDRVMVYRFADNWDGAVIAEDKRADLEPYLGLRYPATDIPQQARHLYTLNPIRIIPDTRYQPVPLVPDRDPRAQVPLDLSLAELRSVSPLHIEYLHNMGVAASMSISLVTKGRLWGLIACHHTTPWRVPYHIRAACEFLGQSAALELKSKETQRQQEWELEARSRQMQLIDRISRTDDLVKGLMAAPEQLMALVGATGVALIAGEAIVCGGRTPTEAEIRDLLAIQEPIFQENLEFHTTTLAALHPAAAAYADIASGLLGIVISKVRRLYILWFRPEVIRTVAWGGNPAKAIELTAEREVRISPRQSFARWEETLQQTAVPWPPQARAVALELRGAIVGIVLRRVTELAEINAELSKARMAAEVSAAAARQMATQLDKAKRAAEAANEAKSAFLANMSHELRSPLNAILGFSRILSRTDLNSQQLEKLAIVQQSGEYLLALINDILDISKIEAGQIVRNDIDFDLSRLLNEIIEMFFVKAQHKDLGLYLEQAPDLPRFIRSDRLKLQQILTNLLGNAIKFTAEGNVKLTARLLEPAPTDSDASIRLGFAVEDTGIGIDPADLDRLFQPFAQTAAGATVSDGTGLGLAIGQSYARLLGGSITVDSQVGTGSTFSLTVEALPALSESSRVGESRDKRRIVSLAPGQPTYRILVVDDRQTNRDLIAEILKPVGFAVREAENGEQALALWQTWQPHLIWMDLQMPGLDGYEVTRRIREAERGICVAVIAITASTFIDAEAKARAAQCNDFILKPVRESDLFDKIARYLPVRYRYESLPARPERAAPPAIGGDSLNLARLPAGWLACLEQAILALDETRMNGLVEQVATQDASLAAVLQARLENFDYESVLTIIERAKSGR